MRNRCRGSLVTAAFLLSASGFAQPVAVKQQRGAYSGFLVLKDGAGKILALGEETDTPGPDGVTSRLMFHFRDGSIDDETALFTQQKVFRLVRDHHLQQGPSFPKPIDVTIDVAKGEVSWVSNGEELKTEHRKLPEDLANGLIAPIIENFPAAGEIRVPFLAPTAKPQLVTFAIRRDGDASFIIGGFARQAERFRIHIEIGGLAGLAAPLAGKQPGDLEIWVMKGDVPEFVRMKGALYPGGPVWLMERPGLVWPDEQR